MRPKPAHAKRLLSLLSVLLLNACATVNFDYPREESHILPNTEETQISEIIERYERDYPGQSGFELLTDGVDALAARLALANEAQISIDTQYYLIKDDLIGYVFIGALLQAADRGVRVRLLLDDIFTSGYDAGFTALDSHPNLEVRVFNPWASRKFRGGDLFSFSRLNRRMHTKSFTADNEATIVGGRNIADEYYGARHDINFGDIDALAIGPIVNEVSTMFDAFWNNPLSMPILAVADMPENPDLVLNELRDNIDQQIKNAENSQYSAAVIADFEKYLAAEEDRFTWAPYVLAYDPPEKANKKLAKDAPSIVDPLIESVMKAQQELIVISPYFVPRKKGLKFFQQLRDRGIEVSIVTNSLAANNHTIVHSGYAPSRKPLLQMGVRIFEVKTTGSTEESGKTGNEDALATLHAKAYIVDSDELFVGSFNWDPRSINLNTEIGVIIESSELTEEMLIRLERGEAKNAYEVVLNDIGQLRWVDRSDGEEVILSKEPDTTWAKRTSAVLMELLPVRGQL